MENKSENKEGKIAEEREQEIREKRGEWRGKRGKKEEKLR